MGEALRLIRQKIAEYGHGGDRPSSPPAWMLAAEMELARLSAPPAPAAPAPDPAGLLGELLAVVFRDGGQRQSEIGDDGKATTEAIGVVVELHEAKAALSAAPAKAEAPAREAGVDALIKAVRQFKVARDEHVFYIHRGVVNADARGAAVAAEKAMFAALSAAAGGEGEGRGRDEELSIMEQLTIGRLIAELSKADPAAAAYYDFVYFHPQGIHSYRGYYDQIALGYADPHEKSITVAEVLEMLTGAIGRTFTGYKGGNYTMREDTPVWVGNPSESTGTAVVGVKDKGWCVILETAKVD